MLRRPLAAALCRRGVATRTPAPAVALGLDFGTESCRAVLVSVSGDEVASAVQPFAHGVITAQLPPQPVSCWAAAVDGQHQPSLQPVDAYQHATDWMDAAGDAVRQVLSDSGTNPASVIGIGVDFTSCTVLPTNAKGDPMFLDPSGQWFGRPHAWPKLWKHHGATTQAEELTAAAISQQCEWLSQYSGVIGSEWLLPKALETFDKDREAFDTAEVFVEAGDWFVWQLVGGVAPPRSSCMAGYKGCFVGAPAGSLVDGLPSADYLNSIRPNFGDQLLAKLPGQVLSPGEKAGELTIQGAEMLGLNPGTPVAAAIIDAHSGVPGAGVGGPNTLVITMGTSGCYMLCATPPADDASIISVPGAFGQIPGGILPGLIGYEMGQAAMGDAFAWVGILTNRPLNEL